MSKLASFAPWLVGVGLAVSAMGQAAASADIDALLQRGWYAAVPKPTAADDLHGLAVWAFAHYHLAPTREVVTVAQRASDGGEVLGTWVLLQCLGQGLGVRHDVARIWTLNHALRQRLIARSAPTPAELYLLQSTGPQDEHGETRHREGQVEQDQQLERQRRSEWLAAAAKGGFAQAENDLGLAAQASKDFAAAIAHYRRAAELGLAEGMKNQAFLLLQGSGAAKDPRGAFELSLRAAEAGDAFAAINVAASLERGWGTDPDPVLSRRWLDRAAATGHWVALLERGMALLRGSYGCAKDQKAALRDLDQAGEVRSAEVLSRLAAFFATGEGVAVDGDRAVALAEAAFVQGSDAACFLLRNVYQEGIGGVDKDDRLAQFWRACAEHGLDALPSEVADEPANKERIARLRRLDPWSVRIVPE